MQDVLKEELVQKILGLDHGIFGREQCAQCDEWKNFEGWGGAMATHQREGALTCSECLKFLSELRTRPAHEGGILTAGIVTARVDSRRAYLLWYADQNRSLVELYTKLLGASLRSRQ